jgi:hypothetical protein
VDGVGTGVATQMPDFRKLDVVAGVLSSAAGFGGLVLDAPAAITPDFTKLLVVAGLTLLAPGRGAVLVSPVAPAP